MCTYHYICRPFQEFLIIKTYIFILLICLCSRNHFIKVLEKGAVLFAAAPDIFSCILFLLPIFQRNIRHVMSHILVSRTDDLSFVYQLLDPVR